MWFKRFCGVVRSDFVRGWVGVAEYGLDSCGVPWLELRVRAALGLASVLLREEAERVTRPPAVGMGGPGDVLACRFE